MQTAEDGLPLPQRYWAVLTLVTRLVVSVLDSSVINIALPTIARDLGVSPALEVASWPWLFAVDVPIGLITLGLALRLLAYTPPSPHRFDVASAVLSAFASASLIGGINGVGHGQAIPLIVLELAGAIIAGCVLVRRQASLSLPLLPVDLFRRPIFALSVTTSVCTFVERGIVFVTLPFCFQDVLGRSQVATGLLMTPSPAMVALVAPVAGRLADRFSTGTLCGIGLGVFTSGFLLLAALPAQPQAADIVWRMMICGFGFRLFGSPNNLAIIASAPRERSGGAGAIQSATRLVGQTVGAALVALIFGFAGPSRGSGSTFAILLAPPGLRRSPPCSAFSGFSISFSSGPPGARLQHPAISGRPNRSADERNSPFRTPHGFHCFSIDGGVRIR